MLHNGWQRVSLQSNGINTQCCEFSPVIEGATLNECRDYVSMKLCSVAKLCLTLCDLMDCSTPGFSALHHEP